MNATPDLPHSIAKLVYWSYDNICVMAQSLGLNIELGGWVVGSNPLKASVYFTSYIMRDMVHITLTLTSFYFYFSFDCRTRYITCHISWYKSAFQSKGLFICLTSVQWCSTKVKKSVLILEFAKTLCRNGFVEIIFAETMMLNLCFASNTQVIYPNLGNYREKCSLLYILFILTKRPTFSWWNIQIHST